MHTNWESELEAAGAFWRHNGNSQLPHAELTSGKHSDGFLNASMAISRPDLLERIGLTLQVPLAIREGFDRIVGSAYGSIPFAYELAAALPCKFGFTEREMVGPMKLKRFEIEPGQKVLAVTHDYRCGSTACGMLGETIAAVKHTGATILPTILALCDRTDLHAFQGYPILSVQHALRFWAPKIAPAIESGAGITVDHPTLLEGIVRDLVPRISILERPDWVIGHGIQSVTFAYAIAKQLCCRAGFTEREFEKSAPLKLARFEVAASEKVMVADDVMTTGGSTVETITAVQSSGATVIGHVAAIANRTGGTVLGEREIISLIQPKFSVWEPGPPCALCAKGSRAIRPKGNWAELTRTS